MKWPTAKVPSNLLAAAFFYWVLLQTGPAQIPSLNPSRHHTGGEIHRAVPAEILTEEHFRAILSMPSNNPGLILRRTQLGAIFHPEILKFAMPAKEHFAPHARPAMVDWRDRWGWNWISSVQNQDPSESCWAFASTALIEAMVRIEHGAWCTRSVVEIRKGVGKTAQDSGNANEALNWVADHGQADPLCSPYTMDNGPIVSSWDRAGRTVRIPKHQRIPNDAGQESAKRWIDAIGPLVAPLDATGLEGIGHDIFHGRGTVTPALNHVVLIVGYDDSQKCWICKNSWGKGFGDNGFFRVGYGEAGIDIDEKYGLSDANPDPWTKRGMHNGNMIESGNGATHRNFEMLGMDGNRLVHWWRQGGDNGDFGWHKAATFGSDAAARPTVSATTYNRNIESIHVTTGGRLHHWFFEQATEKWVDNGVFGPADSTGSVGFIQGNDEVPGKFELVVATRGGHLSHWSRLNGSPWTWTETTTFGENIALSSPSLVQYRSELPENGGNLNLVAVLRSGQMQFWNRRNLHSQWQAEPNTFGSHISSPPCVIEGQFGANSDATEGNFELCVATGGQVQHWWRDNSGDKTWRMSASFGHDVQTVTALLEGSFGFNLEIVVLRNDNQLQHYWRDSNGWHEGVVIGPG